MTRRKSGARGGRADRGGGQFRGQNNHNGRGRGGAAWSPGPGRGRGRGHGYSGSSGSIQEEMNLDFTLQTYADASSPVRTFARGRAIPAYRGRGRGGPFIASQLATEVAFPGRGRGFDIPRRHVQGIGAPRDGRPLPVRVGGKQTLSSLLHQERPLLRPIVFVPSTETRFLFQNEEELLQPIVEHVDDTLQSHIPTADRVTRVFSGGNMRPPNASDKDEDGSEDEEDEIEVVDFNEFEKLLDPISTSSRTTIPKRESELIPAKNVRVHEEETRPLPATIRGSLSPPNGVSIAAQAATAVNGNHLFYVDTLASSVLDAFEVPTVRQLSMVLPDDDDDIIVYDAPHPRNASRMARREEDATEILITCADAHGHTAADISGFSTYEHPAALSTVSNEYFEATVSKAADEPVAPTNVTKPYILDPASFSSATQPFPKAPSTPNTTTSTPRLTVPPITTSRQAKLWKSKLGRASRKKKGTGTSRSARKTSFGALGALREESLLRRLDGERDERIDERRRGDSDLEWGDTTDENVAGAVEGFLGVDVQGQGQERESELDADMKRVLGMLEKGKGKGRQAGDEFEDDEHGMKVDVDVDIATMKRFVTGLTGPDAGAFTTMDDIKCKEIIRMEDEADDDAAQRGSSGNEEDEEAKDWGEEEEEVLKMEEAKFVHDGGPGNIEGVDDEERDHPSESADDDDDDEEEEDDDDLDDEDEDDYEDSSFHTRLARMRANSKEQNAADADFDEDDSDDMLERNLTWADKTEAFLLHVDDVLDDKEDILTAKDRKHKKKMFTSLSDDYQYLNWSSSPARRRRDKYMDLPPELLVQFEKDRQKKAERKKERELERLARAADPFSKKKGGKKGRKAMLTAAAVDPTITVLPNRVIDMTTLVQQIRRFIIDMGGPNSMSLPPTDKQTRKNVHEIAVAFNLKSVSKGKGDARYTTLTKTTKTGFPANEGKIARIVRRSGARGDSFIFEDRKGKGVVRVPRHREGDVVGKAAPKLDQSNIGFRLLAMMGWAEGDRIGASTNGLEAPLSAIIKTTKLGLGAKKG